MDHESSQPNYQYRSYLLHFPAPSGIRVPYLSHQKRSRIRGVTPDRSR